MRDEYILQNYFGVRPNSETKIFPEKNRKNQLDLLSNLNFSMALHGEAENLGNV
jgi:hypothetical protein